LQKAADEHKKAVEENKAGKFTLSGSIYKLMAKQLKQLEGRRTYFVSAEISYWGGGLGPVMVFLLKGATQLLNT